MKKAGMTNTLTYITSPPFTKTKITTIAQCTIAVDTEDVLSLITTEVNQNFLPNLTLIQPTLRPNSKTTIDTRATATMLADTMRGKWILITQDIIPRMCTIQATTLKKRPITVDMSALFMLTDTTILSSTLNTMNMMRNKNQRNLKKRLTVK